ncbi:hypothetical protein M0R45_005194 [Rubus argutus]|uniref:Peptidase A1 domain-containing protein n=1 Tax=Rubus argutus TaxID=59490 RepID=A0AAW1YLW6_RUBAR
MTPFFRCMLIRELLYFLAIQPADGDIGTIGQNFMTGYRTVFDRENMKLGWSRSKCQDLGDAKRMPLTPSPKGTHQFLANH